VLLTSTRELEGDGEREEEGDGEFPFAKSATFLVSYKRKVKKQPDMHQYQSIIINSTHNFSSIVVNASKLHPLVYQFGKCLELVG
jgi:hypothetical protein